MALCRERSLSCHSCCDMVPRFTRSHSKDLMLNLLVRQARVTEDPFWPGFPRDTLFNPMGMRVRKCSSCVPLACRNCFYNMHRNSLIWSYMYKLFLPKPWLRARIFFKVKKHVNKFYSRSWGFVFRQNLII